MKRFSYIVFLLPILAILLLSGCGTGDTTHTPNLTATTTPQETQTPYPTRTAADICPKELSVTSTCLTPHALRQAYGIDSLIQKGFTGKGQTVIDMVSFGSPTLQQ